MIVTLAGHVDHGKTTLVRLLTGKDTDRLIEEQRRGLTIDLGFAYLSRQGQTVGFVDVPGHHRFIHNMVAGVAAMQHALLVIAADDGPMPQSREHLQILELIGLTQGVVALSKCDRVTRGRIDEARAEIAELVSGTFLEGAPVIETAAEGAVGIDTLRDLLLERAAQLQAAQAPRPFRMAVDRAFNLKGAGLVVTGTVHSGAVAPEQTLHVFPGGASARVRGLHVQDQAALSATVGDRTAINLSGVDDLARGHWLSERAEPGHRNLVLDVRVLDDFPRAIRHWLPVHVYHATTHTTARLALLDGSRLQPGERARAELVLDEPLLAKRNDRLVIRDQSLDRTLGGGVVIDNRPRQGRRRVPARMRTIDAYAAATAATSLDALLALGPVELDAFRGVWDLRDPEFDGLLRQRPASVRQKHLVSDSQWQVWTQALRQECEDRHAGDAALQGLRENDFAAPVPEAFRTEALNALVADGALEQRAGRYQPKRHQVALAPAEQTLLDRLTPLLDQPQPPSLGDIGKTLRVPLPLLQKSVKALASKGAVMQINDKRLYLPDQVQKLVETAEALGRQGPFTARDYRDAAGIGRNVAIDVLEFFDARGFTRRNGDTRTVVGERSRVMSA